ncbi:MAG: hypothetical protein EPO11_01050 [Gammaproteobacteria bacterium]|nr:MAG: hypothetical protein EPO11_01050 [Gammaproteobacteria bacterium]
MQHSARLYENENIFHIKTILSHTIEQQIKIIVNNKPQMLNAIGLVLEKTIFHPQGGGQPADQGTINGFPVITVKEDKSQLAIYHFIDAAQINTDQFQPGMPIEAHVNTSFRQQCQRSHSAGHLIADILEFNPLFNIYSAKASHGHHFPGEEYIKIELRTQPNDLQQFCNDLNHCIKQSIQDDLPVSCFANSHSIRHIQIGSSARMCGGTHVSSTRELVGCQVTKAKCSLKNGKIETTIFYSSQHANGFP